MAKLGRPIDIDKYLGKVKNRVYKVGVELEGLWPNLDPNIHLDVDTSVQVPAPPGSPNARTGELVSEPLEPIRVGLWMKRFYPPVVNHTCGMHVHVSFRDARHYGLLTDPAFQPTVIAYFTRWAEREGFPPAHHFWARLRGESPYCQIKHWPGMQMVPQKKDHDRNRPGHRYTVINYPFNVNRTIECRLLPMMETKEQGVRAVKHFLEITNASLVALREKEIKLTGEVVVGRAHIEHTLEEFRSWGQR